MDAHITSISQIGKLRSMFEKCHMLVNGSVDACKVLCPGPNTVCIYYVLAKLIAIIQQ